MQASNKGTHAPPGPRWDGSPQAAAEAALDGAVGFSVRCTPRRQTLRVETAGVDLYVKLRDGRLADARAEWHWLHVLGGLGLRVPEPLAFVVRGRRSALVTGAVAGRPCDAWFRGGGVAGRRGPALAFACGPVARAVAALHAQGLVYRDLYWNHVFATGLGGDAVPVFLDVERVFRPRFRFERWRVKDLAGLRSSLPVAPSLREVARFLCAYSAALGLDPSASRRRRRDWIKAAGRKAARIASHQPKYG